MYPKKKCMKCGEPATHKFTRIEKGQVYDLFLCADHAAEESPYQTPKIPLSDILEGLLKPDAKLKSGGAPVPANLHCGHCGLTFEAYRKNLLLGCSECYASFHDQMIPDLRRFHGDTRHCGRRPGGGKAEPLARDFLPAELELESAGAIPKEEKAPAPPPPEPEQDWAERLEELTLTLHRAVAEENFALAARCRDQIREVREKIAKLKEKPA